MQKQTKTDLEKRSKEIFRLNARANELHATEDGNFFEKKSDARNHNLKVVKGEVHSFYRDGIVPEVAKETNPVSDGPTKVEVKTQAPSAKTKAPKAKKDAKNQKPPATKKVATPGAKRNTKPVVKADVKTSDPKDGGAK